MTSSIEEFCEWLAATSLSIQIQTIDWLIPTVQTIHILSIAIVMSAAAMVHLHVLGVLPRSQPLAAVAHRFLPWIWWTLLVLLLTGTVLIIGEPERALPNPAFVWKLSMLAVVMVLTFIFQRGLRLDGLFWQKSHGRRIAVRLIAAASLALWVAIVVAGRLIAYIDVGVI